MKLKRVSVLTMFVISIFAFSSVVYADFNDGLMHVWPFTSGSTSDSINGLTFTGTSYTSEGKRGEGRDLSSGLDAITVDAPPTLEQYGYTICFWNKWNGVSSHILLWHDSSNAGSSITIGYGGVDNKIFVWTNSGSWSQSNADALNGQWQFICLIVNNSVAKLYVNSGEELIVSNPGSQQTTGTLRSGNSQSMIDEIMIWNRMLTSDEINELWSNSNGLFYPFPGCVDNDNDTFDKIDNINCATGTDCNDNNPNIYPGAPEICNGIDSNCDNIITCINEFNCSDQIDNDNDTFVDYDDQDCFGKKKINLTEGWNLVQSPYCYSEKPIENATNSIKGCFKSIFGYNSTSDQWQTYDPIRPFFLNSLINVNPFWGYWVNVNCSEAEWSE